MWKIIVILILSDLASQSARRVRHFDLVYRIQGENIVRQNGEVILESDLIFPSGCRYYYAVESTWQMWDNVEQRMERY